jgi:hypothetical protein
LKGPTQGPPRYTKQVSRLMFRAPRNSRRWRNAEHAPRPRGACHFQAEHAPRPRAAAEQARYLHMGRRGAAEQARNAAVQCAEQRAERGPAGALLNIRWLSPKRKGPGRVGNRIGDYARRLSTRVMKDTFLDLAHKRTKRHGLSIPNRDSSTSGMALAQYLLSSARFSYHFSWRLAIRTQLMETRTNNCGRSCGPSWTSSSSLIYGSTFAFATTMMGS